MHSSYYNIADKNLKDLKQRGIENQINIEILIVYYTTLANSHLKIFYLNYPTS